jgi:hypothetical protein
MGKLPKQEGPVTAKVCKTAIGGKTPATLLTLRHPT